MAKVKKKAVNSLTLADACIDNLDAVKARIGVDVNRGNLKAALKALKGKGAKFLEKFADEIKAVEELVAGSRKRGGGGARKLDAAGHAILKVGIFKGKNDRVQKVLRLQDADIVPGEYLVFKDGKGGFVLEPRKAGAPAEVPAAA